MKHFFYKGSKDILENRIDLEAMDKIISEVKKEFEKVVEVRNLSFLLGSGCSSGEGGIPTMKQLSGMFYQTSKEKPKITSEIAQKLALNEECRTFLAELGIVCTLEPFVSNIEAFLGTLYSLKFYYEQTNKADELIKIERVIKHTKDFILYHCLNVDNNDKDLEIRTNYKNFYRKLSLRDSNLPRPNIFTANYDLYSEIAMDDLGITYTNGFSGFVERYFNPSIFNYALAEQMEISSGKWNVIDSFIYLFKIHGSVNWIEEQGNNKLFKIKELQQISFKNLRKQENLMIYPSSIKQNASLGSPYSDLFREFQRRIAQNQSVLITIGYSFNDEHINNLIYQALTIPTFRLVIFSELGFYSDNEYRVTRENINRLKNLNDPRIWIIGSDAILHKYEAQEKINEQDVKSSIGPEDVSQSGEVEFDQNEGSGIVCDQELKEPLLYYFSTISNKLLPDWSDNQIEDSNNKIIDLIKTTSQPQNTQHDQG